MRKSFYVFEACLIFREYLYSSGNCRVKFPLNRDTLGLFIGSMYYSDRTQLDLFSQKVITLSLSLAILYISFMVEIGQASELSCSLDLMHEPQA